MQILQVHRQFDALRLQRMFPCIARGCSCRAKSLLSSCHRLLSRSDCLKPRLRGTDFAVASSGREYSQQRGRGEVSLLPGQPRVDGEQHFACPQALVRPSCCLRGLTLPPPALLPLSRRLLRGSLLSGGCWGWRISYNKQLLAGRGLESELCAPGAPRRVWRMLLQQAKPTGLRNSLI